MRKLKFVEEGCIQKIFGIGTWPLYRQIYAKRLIQIILKENFTDEILLW